MQETLRDSSLLCALSKMTAWFLTPIMDEMPTQEFVIDVKSDLAARSQAAFLLHHAKGVAQ